MLWTKTRAGLPLPARMKCMANSNRALTPISKSGSEPELFFGVQRLVGGDQLLLELRRRGLVVAELHAVGAVAGGERLEARREVLQLGERRLRRDLHGAGARGV